MPLNSAHTKLIVVVLIALTGCRADPQPTPAPLLAPPPPSTTAHAYSSTFVVQTALLPDKAGLLLLGRRRPDPGSWASEAWIAEVNHEGALRWETSVDIPGAWAEHAIVDPLGGLHVFGRSVNDGAWLASLDAQGQQQALRPLPNAALRGFGLRAAELHVLLDAQDPDRVTNCPAIVSWTRVGWSQPATLTTVLGSTAHWTILAETRHRPDLCGTAGGLRYDLIEGWGVTPPAWEADLSSKCDILYVLCTGMQPGLEALVTDSRGLVTRVQTCDDWSAKSSDPDGDEGNRLCRPERRPVALTDIGIPLHFPTACAAGNPLMQHSYSCEDPAMLKQTHNFRFRSKRDASLELTRVDVFVERG